MGGMTKRSDENFITLNGGLDEYADTWAMNSNRLQQASNIFIDGEIFKMRPGKQLFGPAFSDTFIKSLFLEAS